MTGTSSGNAAATAGHSSTSQATTSKPSAKPSAGRATRCPGCGRKHKRTHQANARYWLLLHTIAEKVKPNGEAFSAEAFHTYFKSRYLGCDDMKLPNGKTLPIPHSSADLDTAEFNTYMEQVEAWAAERDVYLDELPE